MTGTRDTYHYEVDQFDSYEEDAASVHPLAFDWAIYAHHLRESDLTEAQKGQLIETLWTIATLFVDYGFGLHPVQQACGEDADLAALIAEDVIDWNEYSNDDETNESDALMAVLPEGVTR